MDGDYPAGVENDPNAPFNEINHGVCIYCEGTGKTDCLDCTKLPSDMVHHCLECEGATRIICDYCQGSGEITEEQLRDERESHEEDMQD